MLSHATAAMQATLENMERSVYCESVKGQEKFMRYLRYLAVTILTFVFGVGISPIHFYFESVACGSRNSTWTYRSSYFVQTSFGNVVYDSEETASEAFNQRLNRAIKVVNRAPKVNKQGLLIEQRALALFFDAGNKEYYAAAIWTEGRVLRSIHSSSFVHVMEFEKQNF